MISITSMSREFTPIEKYVMTVSPGLKVMKDVHDGTTLDVTGYLEFDDVDTETGEKKTLFSVLTADGTAYSMQSKTFRNSFMDAVTTLGEPHDQKHGILPISKFSGENRSGRPFINCQVDINRYMELANQD